MSANQFSVKVLGNCATQTSTRETTSFLVCVGSEKILFDCGPGIVKQLQLAKVSLIDITGIVITHCHADHTASYPYLLFSVNLARSMYNNRLFGKIPVIALESVHNGISAMLSTQYPIEGLEEKLVDKCVYNKEEFFQIGDVVIRPFNSFHNVPSIGAVFEYAGKKLSFTSDTLYSNKLSKFVVNSDLLVHEAFCDEKLAGVAKKTGHSTAREAGMTAKNANVKALVLTHPLAVTWNYPDVLVSDAAENYKGQIYLPKEMDELEV